MQNKRILSIITGSVAAYKALDVLRQLGKSGNTITTILTQGATQFITPTLIEGLTSQKCYTHDTGQMEHIFLSRNVDAILICPASANFIANIALGIGGSLAQDLILAKLPQTPVLICPAMNPYMYSNHLVNQHISSLRHTPNYYILDPVHGETACMEEGLGKLPPAETIIDHLSGILNPYLPLNGKTAIVTAGATVEPIDDVRFISNFSSGKQGSEIATHLAALGAKVHLVHGTISVPIPSHSNIHPIYTVTAKNMLEAVTNLINAHPVDFFISSAAVSDFAPQKTDGKIKKTPNVDQLTLTMHKTPDILHTISNLKTSVRPKYIVGFAAEDSNNQQNLWNLAYTKLKAKNCDAILANAISAGKIFNNNNTTTALLINKNDHNLDQSINLSNCTKVQVAQEICKTMIEYLSIQKS